jgi:ubiquinone/menaquinone biosynthesis C-methylase UbiE
VAVPDRDHQERVDSYFDSVFSYWTEIYDARSVEGVIYQLRRAVALRWVDNLALPQGSKILDVGCGAGVITIELARRGYTVDGMDSSEIMVERALRGALAADVGDRVNVFRGDARSLQIENERFALVLAIGVIPWLDEPGMAVREMARVVEPGGYVMLTADNRTRLNHLMDPRWNHTLGPARRLLKRLLIRTKIRKPSPNYYVANHFHSTSHIDRILSHNGLEKVKAVTLGFGPFSLLGVELLPESLGIKLHRRLQAFADLGVPGFRSTGSQYLVLARKATV